MTTETKNASEALKDFIHQAKTQMLPHGLITQAEIDRWDSQLKYTVNAGGYEADGSLSTDYSDAFLSIEDAFVALKKYSPGQPWANLTMHEGEFVYALDATRIMVRDPATGYFFHCDDDGIRLPEIQYSHGEQYPDSQEDERTFDLEDALESLNASLSHNDLVQTLSGFSMILIHAMAQESGLNVDNHLESCDQLAMELDVGELKKLATECAAKIGV